MIRFDARVRHVPGCLEPRPCGTSTCTCPKASWCSWSVRPVRARRPCCARSTAWCRTSRAARSPARSPWTAAPPAPTRPASWPTSSGTWGRTRCPASSPTPSRTSWPTGWRAWACHRRRCAAGSRRPSTCSASPSCADRPLLTLSAGQQQRVAIGSVLTSAPRVLVLDEPTSALDPPAAEEVLAALTRLVHDLGLTVLLAEHRLERVVQYADRVVHVTGDGRAIAGLPARSCSTSPVAPPVVELGRLAGWSPLPLSVRDARRASAAVTSRLQPLTPRPVEPDRGRAGRGADRHGRTSRGPLRRCRGPRVISTSTVRPGEVVALMGRNGAGKSTLLASLVGLRRPDGGQVTVAGSAPHARRPVDAVRTVGLVPHDPGDLLYCESVDAECAETDRTLLLARWYRAGAARPDRTRDGRAAPPARPVRGAAPRSGPGCRARLVAVRCSCWTSRPAGWTTPPSTASSRCCTSWRPPVWPW